VRELAFGAVAEALSDKEVSQHFEDSHNPAIRRRALVELHQRKAKGVEGLALDTLGRVGATGVDRAQAAEIYVQLKGTRAADKLIELALKKAPTPELLRVTIAELLGGLDDPSVNKKLKSLVGRGKPHEKIFALYATRHLDDADLLKKIRKGLNDRDAELRITTAQMLGERQDTEAVAQLEKMLGKAKSSDEKAVAIHALSHLYQGDQKWLEQLKSHVQKGDRQVRNAALQDLGQLKNPELLDFFVEYLFHEDWATRRISLHSLEGLRDARALGPIIERMARETGRMLVDFANTLWNLTGLPYDNEQPTWQKWWDNEGASFQVIDPSKLTQKEEEREERQLRRSTDVQFFGIRIVSHRVIFIIDVSGSMVQPLQTEMIDGRKATRMDVVKREIKESIEELEPAAFFNIVTFNSAVTLWLKEGIATSTKRSREEALQYIDRLGSRGGTNIFESLEVAFTDADVDTIFLLSDGEPTAGRIVDPHLIRQQVQRWNADRGIQIHTIAVGGALRVLEWIAQDSGGTYVKYN
jgi:HEAT repeat protein